MGKGTGAAANTREVISFLVWAHKKGKKKKIEKRRKSKKIEKNQKSKKGKSKKIKKGKRKKNLFSVVLDKICVFCLYPIPDSQQYVKRAAVDA